MEHIFHLTGEYGAQIIQRGGGDVPVLLQGIQGAPAERVFLDERIGGDPPAPHSFPQRIVGNDRNRLLAGSIILAEKILEYSR